MNLDLLWRGSRDAVVRADLEKKLGASRRLRIKLGIDPTGPNIHLGYANTFRKLRLFQEAGHQIVAIIGDFTAKIGDTSDKTSLRPVLNDDQIKANMEDYLPQLNRILDMKKVEVHYNSEWLSKLKLDELIKIAQQFTVAQMIERENFALRFREQKPIGSHELLYPLLQGYDSVAIKADVEIGGTDQLFNLMAGRTVQKYFNQDPQNLITYELLQGTDGRKMSKSWGNTINVTDEPNDMYGKVMSIPDELIAHYLELCTEVPQPTIEAVVKSIAEGANPRDAKASLAREIVTIYYGSPVAKAAEAEFNRVFRDKNEPEEIVTAGKAGSLVDFITSTKLASSKSEARRLISQGGVRVNGEAAADEAAKVASGDLVNVGKRHFYRVKE